MLLCTALEWLLCTALEWLLCTALGWRQARCATLSRLLLPCKQDSTPCNPLLPLRCSPRDRPLCLCLAQPAAGAGACTRGAARPGHVHRRVSGQGQRGCLRGAQTVYCTHCPARAVPACLQRR